MSVAYLSLGTNLGDKKQNIITAVGLLTEKGGRVLALSDLYETKPWGFNSQNTFLNAALILETSLSPFQLLDVTQSIERKMGRTEKTKNTYNDRIIDMDILMYDDIILDTEELIIPHPLMHERNFVLGPLAEIAATLIHPVLKKSIGELYLSLPL